MHVDLYGLSALAALVPSVLCALGNSKFKPITFKTTDDGLIHGSLLEAGKELCVVFAHGMVFNKESWYPVAEHFRQSGISSLSIDFRGYGNSKAGTSKELYFDILGATDFLKKSNYEHIALVGGSMGAAAITHAVAHSSDLRVSKIILLAPAGGDPVKSDHIQKLFVVSAEDSFYEAVESLYVSTNEPKTFKVYTGSSHAQHMFKTDFKDELLQLMLRFLQS
jgi:pimeloyl-ACP methyl ester carboxylesterase